jgi:phage shock protein C
MNKKLYRSRKEKMIGGVAGGLAEYFEIDPTLVRIIFIVSLFLGGSGILAYIILWILVPEEPYIMSSTETKEQTENANQNVKDDAQYNTAYQEQRNRRRNVLGAILIIFGVMFLANNLIPRFDFGDYWPLILIILGVVVLINSKQN